MRKICAPILFNYVNKLKIVIFEIFFFYVFRPCPAAAAPPSAWAPRRATLAFEGTYRCI